MRVAQRPADESRVRDGRRRRRRPRAPVLLLLLLPQMNRARLETRRWAGNSTKEPSLQVGPEVRELAKGFGPLGPDLSLRRRE